MTRNEPCSFFWGVEANLLPMLFPHLANLLIIAVERAEDHIEVVAATRTTTSTCPSCSTASDHLHSRYERSLSDLGPALAPMRIRLTVKRFRCRNAECERMTFAEQVLGLTSPKARQTPSLRRAREAIGLALAGRAGARLASRLGMRASRSSLLRLVRALPDPQPKEVRVLGVDDFAFRRGRTYGTILVDMDTHLPIDLLNGRESEPLRSWLTAHRGIEVICRDRANPYAEAATSAAPRAVQVADRFHLWQNLVGAVEECLMHRRDALAEPLAITGTVQVVNNIGDEPHLSQGRMATRARAHHRLVHDLLGQGHGLREVTRRLGWSRNTVRRDANAQYWQDRVTPHRPRPSKLDSYKDYLHAQWQAGRGNARHLHAEIQVMGYTGSYANTAAYLTKFRSGPAVRPAIITTPSPTVREATGWMTRHPNTLSEEDCLRFKALLARSEDLGTAHDLVKSFAHMLTERTGQDLPDWITAAHASALPGFRRFARGLRKDFEAVTAGLTLPYSSGAVEGNVNRLKMIKRQMYGRANLDLLRIRVLLDRLSQGRMHGF